MSFVFDIKKGQKTIFIHIPKNGGRSVLSSLNEFNQYKSSTFKRPGKEFIGHLTMEETKPLVESLGKYNTFCVLRNPWDRMVSYYHYIKQNGKIEHGIHLQPDTSFEQFVDMVIESDNKVFQPQINYIVDEDGDVCIDHVLMLDNIQEDLNELVSTLGSKKECVVNKINSSSHGGYHEYYNETLVEKVSKFEKGVIDLYNFKF